MKTKFLILSIFFSSLPLSAQTGLDAVMDSVFTHNTTLKALRAELAADNAASRADLSLDDANVDFGYLWGGPRSLGERKDFSVSQTFDVATLTGAKRSWARSREALAQSRYRAQAAQIVTEARQACIDVIYYNALTRLLEDKRQNLAAMATLVARETDRGGGDALTLRAARLALAAIVGELQQCEAERGGALVTLERLCGGRAVTLTDTVFPAVACPENFEALWTNVVANHPGLAAISAEVREAEQSVKLARQNRLPRLTVGFLGEYLAGERYQGPTIGLSLPLFGGGRRAKQAIAEQAAAESRRADAEEQVRGFLKEKYERAKALKALAAHYDQALSEADGVELLGRALHSGRIAMADYLVGHRSLFELRQKRLDTMRKLHQMLTELWAAQTASF